MTDYTQVDSMSDVPNGRWFAGLYVAGNAREAASRIAADYCAKYKRAHAGRVFVREARLTRRWEAVIVEGEK